MSRFGLHETAKESEKARSARAEISSPFASLALTTRVKPPDLSRTFGKASTQAPVPRTLAPAPGMYLGQGESEANNGGESMKLLFKPALTAKWPSDKGLGGHLNCACGAISRDKICALLALAARIMSRSGSPRSHPLSLRPVRTGSSSKASSRSDGTRVKLQDLPFRLLVLLVERPGEIVTREEVRQRLWPQDTFVEFDNSLGVAVRKLREALRDDAEAPRFVETIPRRGYRFVAPVTVEDSGTISQPPTERSRNQAAEGYRGFPASGRGFGRGG